MTVPVQGAQRRLLPGGRLAGPMPWVIAIMMFLTVLATAAGLGIGGAARTMRTMLAGKVTVQVVDANPDTRSAQRYRVVAAMRRLANVTLVAPVTDAEVRDLLTPWLGTEGLDAELPIPALIDVRLADASPRAIADLTAVVHAVAPSARVDRHADWLGPVGSLLNTLQWLSVGLVGLAATATAATVVLGARAALDQHRATIDVMHLMGASDRQIARLFERGVARDAVSGSALGFVAAIGALIVVGTRLQSVGAALFAGGYFGWFEGLAIALLPVAGVVVALLAARFAVMRALAKIL